MLCNVAFFRCLLELQVALDTLLENDVIVLGKRRFKSGMTPCDRCESPHGQSRTLKNTEYAVPKHEELCDHLLRDIDTWTIRFA
jgi:hypothetical protein